MSTFVGPAGLEHTLQPMTVQFTSDMLYSHNFFKPAWHGKSVRRMKSTICMLEWIPDPELLRTNDQLDLLGPSGAFPETKALLALCFNLLNARGARATTLSLAHTVRMLRCLDVDVELEERHENLRTLLGCLKQLTETDFYRAVQTEVYYQFQQGRFYIAVSLQEAAGIRALIHTWRQFEAGRFAHTGDQDPVPALALRMCGSGALQDATDSYVPGPPMQLFRAVQAMKYFNGDADYSAQGERALLRALQRSEKRQRQQFWMNVCICRRRKFLKLTDEPITRVFSFDNEVVHLGCAVLAHRVMSWIPSKGLGYSEAYEFLSQEGVLDLDMLKKQLELIFRTSFPPLLVNTFFDRLDTDRDGHISFAEFKSGIMAMTGAVHDESSASADGEAMLALVSGSETIPILWGVLSQVTVSIGSASSVDVLFSLPEFTIVGMSATIRGAAYPMGHGLVLAGQTNSLPCLQIYNPTSADVGEMLDAHFLPPPRSFILAATVELAGQTLYVWYPLARDHYMALGMIVTKTREAPPVDSLRTLPLSLTRPAEAAPTRLSPDGTHPLSVNSLGLLVVPTFAGVVLNHELNLSLERDASSLTLQDAFTLTSWR